MSENLFDLSGEVAVVIGATGALGGACARAMAKAGAKVAVAGRNPGRGEARVCEIADAGGQAHFFWLRRNGSCQPQVVPRVRWPGAWSADGVAQRRRW
ncbi:MAG: hypothetical protein CM1200mP29_09790 [Verrucomicrobiota bacterium]|nr:MAG: hypothetical protein CM1200mP29_09790 [Verrucomicrobiota bacterium]